MVLTSDRVLQVLNQRGPSVPTELTSLLGENSMIVGAFLSELVSKKEVLMTHAKLGGSSLYYTKQHHKNITRLRQHLNEKDRSAYDKLEQAKVLRDDELSPLDRTCMRNLRDFALPVKVRFQGQELLFWRWFLSEQTQAQELIEKQLNIVGQKNEKPTQEPSPPANTIQTEQEPEQKIPDVTPKPEPPQEKNTTTKNNTSDSTTAENPKPVSTTKKPIAAMPKQQSLLDNEHTTDEKTKNDAFFQTIQQYLQEKNITISYANVIRANSEIELIVDITSSVGTLTYYARARKKKTCNEGDIATAVVQGQLRHLPVLFLCTGTLTKKTKQALKKEYTMVTVVEEVSA